MTGSSTDPYDEIIGGISRKLSYIGLLGFFGFFENLNFIHTIFELAEVFYFFFIFFIISSVVFLAKTLKIWAFKKP